MGITSTLSLAAQALKAQQQAIQTTGHNLANSATPGFSRQRVDMVTAYPSFQGGVFFGQGVDVAGVQRIIDRFAESELLSLKSNVGYADAQSQALLSIQDAFPTTGGISGALSAFFGALSDLTNNPGGTAERVSLIGKANALGSALAQTRQILGTEQQNFDETIKDGAQQFNSIVSQIAALNRQISTTEVGGESANDFRDKRQTLLQNLVSLTGATTREESNGEITVTMGGLLLVGGDRYASLETAAVGAGGLHILNYITPSGQSLDATSLFTEGKIGSLLSLRDTQVPDMINRLDQLAQTLADEVNNQHALGFDLNGAAGGNFFTPITATAGAAANIRVDAALVANPRLIAAAAAADTVPGDNRNAQAMVDLQSTSFAALGGFTLEDSFLSLVGDVASQAQNAQDQTTFKQALLTQAQARRESVSGVNVDEEMTKLIQFQRAFEASSLLVRTVDDMYQSLIDMVQ